MATIFKRSKGDINYFSDKEIQPSKDKLKSLDELRVNMSDEAYEATLASINAEAEDGEAVDADLKALERISERYEFLAPLARDTRGAQVAMAVTLLNQKPKSDLVDHVTEVKKASKATWQNLRDWCDEPAEAGAGKKKSGKLRVPTGAARALDDQIKKGKDAAAARRKKAAENKANGSS